MSCARQCSRVQGDADAQEAPARRSPPRGCCPCRVLRAPAPWVGMPLPTLLSQLIERVEVGDATTQTTTGGRHPGPGGRSWRKFQMHRHRCESFLSRAWVSGCFGGDATESGAQSVARSDGEIDVAGGGAAAQLNACHRVSFFGLARTERLEKRADDAARVEKVASSGCFVAQKAKVSALRARAVRTGFQCMIKGWDMIGSGFVRVGFPWSNFLANLDERKKKERKKGEKKRKKRRKNQQRGMQEHHAAIANHTRRRHRLECENFTTFPGMRAETLSTPHRAIIRY